MTEQALPRNDLTKAIMLFEEQASGLVIPRWLGGTADAAHVHLKSTGIPFPDEKVYTAWSLGDAQTAITVAASATQAAGPLDCTLFRRDHGTIVVIIGGTGTAKITAEISRDGATDLASLGDIVTGLTAGQHVIALNDSNLIYGHYLTLSVVETGGANSVTAKIFCMARGG